MRKENFIRVKWMLQRELEMNSAGRSKSEFRRRKGQWDNDITSLRHQCHTLVVGIKMCLFVV